MKSFKGLITLMAFLSAFSVNAATLTWTGTTNSDWNTGSNWGGTAPLAGDIANIPGGLTNYPVINNTVIITTVNINSSGSGATLTVTTGGSFTVLGLITINANGSFIQTGGTSTLAGITSSAIINLSGGTITSTVDITQNSGATLTQSGGVLHLATTTGTNPTASLINSTGATVTQSGGTFAIKNLAAGGGTFNQTGSSALLKVFLDWKPGTGSVFNSTAGTVEFTGTAVAGDFASGSRQFTNIIIDAAVNPGFETVAGSTIPLSGDFTNNNSSLPTQTINTTITLNGTGTQNFYSASANSITNNLVITKTAGTANFTSAIKAGNFTLNGGAVTTTASNYAFSATGNVILNAGSLSLNNSTVTITGNYTNSGTDVTAGTAAITITGNYFTDGGTYTGASSTISVAGNWTNNNSSTFSAGTVTFTGALKTIGGTVATTFSALSIKGTDTLKTSLSCTALTMPVSAVAASFVIATGVTLTVNGDVTINQPSASVTVVLTINAGSVIVNGNVNIGGTNTTTARIARITITTGTLTVSGNIVFNSASGVNATAVLLMSGGAGTTNLGGNIILTNTSGTLTPGTTSTFVYNGTGSQTITKTAAITFNHITINKSSGTATLGAALTANNLNLLQGTLNSGGLTMTLSGSVLNNGGTLTGSPATTFTGASKTISGTGTTDFGTMTFNSGSSCTISNTNTCTGLTVPAPAASTTITQTATGILTINGDVNLNQPTAASKTTSWAINSGTATVTGNINIGGTNTTTTQISKITITTGTLNANGNIVFNSSATTAGTANITMSGGAGTLNLKGALTLTNGTGTLTPGTTSTVNFNGTSAQSVNFGSAIVYNHINVNNPATVTISAAVTSAKVLGNIRVQSGVFNNGGFAIGMATSKTFQVVNGATFFLAGTTGMVTGTTIVKTFDASSTVEYGGTNQTVSNETYGHLTLSSSSGAAVKTMPGTALTIAGNLTSSVGAGTSVSFTAASNISVAGNVLIGASTTFDGSSFSHSVAGNWTNNGTYTVSTSTVTMTGTSKTISGSGTLAFNNLVITGSGITAGAVNISVAGNLSTTGLGSFTHGSGGGLTMTGTSKTISGTGFTFNDLTLNGSISSSSVIAVTGNLAAGSGGSFTTSAGSVTMSGTSKTITATGSISLYNLTVTGSITTATNLTISSALAVSTGTLTASAGTTTFISTSSLSGTANLYNVTINGTSLQLTTNSVLGIAGAYSITSGTLDVTTSIPNTVHFNSSGAQTIATGTFHHLMFTGNTKTAGGAITANGDLTINVSTTFAGSSYTHIIKGNWINSGTFTAGTSTIQFTGSADASINGATTFSSITINKSASTNTVNLSSDVSVSTVNMTQGILNTGTSTVNITTTRTGAGIILGNIQRTHSFTTGVAYEFEGQNNSITFTSVSGVTSILVRVTLGSIADFPFGGSINRLYDITIPSGTYSATLRLHYEDAELNGNSESSMNLWNYNSVWTNAGKSNNSTSLNYVEQTGLTNIATRWTFSDDNNVISWNGSVSSDWATAANWTIIQGAPSGIPSSNDVVQIGFTAYTNAPIISMAATAKSISFGSTTTSTLSLTTGGSLTTQGNIGGTWTSNAIHTINTNGQTITINGDVALSDGTSGHAINLNISTGTFTMTGSLTESGGANITFSGAGSLNIGENFIYTSGTFTKGTGTVTYNGTVSQTVAAVNYNNLVINKSGIATISSTTTISGDLTITAGELDIAAASTITGNVAIATGATLVSGNITNSVGGNWSNSGTFTPSTGTITLNGSGTQTVSASAFNNLTINKSGGAVLSGNVTITGNISLLSGTLDLATYTANRTSLGGSFSTSNGTTLYLAGAANFPSNYSTYTLGATSTVNYNGTVAQSVSGITYGHLVFNNGTTNAKTLAASATVAGDLTINSGATFSGGAFTLSISGNWTNSGTFTPSTSTVNLSGTSKNINGNTTFNKLTVFGSYTVPGNDLTTNGLFYIPTGGTLASTTGTLTISGDITNNGTLTSTETTTFTGTVVQTIQFSNATTTLNVVNFNGTVSPTISSTSASTYSTVNINNTGGVTANISWTTTTAFNIASGASFNGGSATHNYNGSFTNNGSASTSGTFNFNPSATQTIKLAGTNFSSTGTLIFGGTGAITVTGSPNTLTNVTVSNSTGVTPSANWTMGGSFSINSSSIFNAGSYSYAVAGDILSAGTLNGGTSSFTMSSGSGTLSGSNGTTFYDFTISGTIAAIADFNVAHNFTNNGSYDGTAATLTMTGSTASVIGGTATTYNLAQLSIQKSTGVATTLAHNILAVSSLDITSGILDASTYTITQNAGDLFILDNATLKIGGTNSLPAFTTYSLDTLSTVEYYGSTQSVSAATSYGNLTISTTGSKTAAAALTITNNFTLTTGTFVGGSFTHTLSGNWSMSSGTFTNTGTTILFNGTANQTVTSTGAFNHLTVNKPAGDIVLGGNISLSGTLTFTLGKINTGSYIVITTSGTVSGAAQSTGWVNGKMQRTFSTGTNVAGTFYVGGTTYYSPVIVTFASVTGGGAIMVSNADGAHPNLPASGISADKNIPRYWTITNTGSVAFTTYTVSLTWNTAENYAGLNTTLLKVGKYTSSAWTFPTITGTPTTSNIQANGINTFGDFVCGQTCDVTAGFSYTGTPYCSNAGTVTITLSSGATSGVFTATPAGLSINSSTGAVTLGTSTAGTYTVTNTATGTGGCTTAATTTIVITTAPSATISYSGTPFCSNAGTGTVTRTGTAGGTYSSTAGLTINSTTGAITTGTSTAGTYTVTYTVAAAGGCSLYTTTTTVTITTAPSATISYSGTPFCSNAGTGTVTQTGTTGGTYSSTTGLSINSSTGAITTGTSTAGTYTVTYTIAAAGGCSLFSTTTSVTITALPSATISYSSSPYCKLAGTATVTRTGTTGGTYSSTAGLTIDTNSGDINTGTSTVGTYTVTYTVTGGGCSLYTTTTSVSIVTAGTWTGAVSNNWNTSGNWLCGTVPTSAINATIPTGLSVYPTISSGTGAVNNITIQTGASLTVSGATLQVAGSISNSGTFTASNGTIEMNGSSAQTIPAGVFAGNVIKDLTINNNAGVTLAGTLNMSNELTVSNGSLTTGGYLKLLSTDTTTARVARITSAAGTPISGNVTVERYIKGRRKYRLITSSVTTSASTTLTSGQEGLSIWGNWQNQANNSTANTGTFITGGSAADGFDQQTPNASLFTYNSTTRLFEGFTTANGKNTKYTPLKAGVPYYMFVYGDRTNTTITSTPNKTVLIATGTLLTGDQTYTTSSAVPLSNTTGGYTMLGNPFASPIDWGTVSRTNLSDTYWGWDPNLNSTGGYVTVSTTGTTTLISPFSGSVGLNQYIQSGQGFFVKTTAASPVLTIRETDKTNNFNGIAFRTGTNNISLMAVNLIYDDAAGPMLMDGALAAFDPSFSNQVGNEDASKIIKSGEGLAMQHQSALLSIDARKIPVNGDTLFINTTSLTKPQYRLQIFAKQMDSSTLEPYLEDTYLNTSKLLSLVDTNYVTFTVSSAIPASTGPNRFRIVFRQSGDLSGIISSIRAVKENLDVKVNWDVSSENGVQKYELQRADAANSFTRLGEVMATGNNTSQNYQEIDNSPASGTNYYRVKVIMTDGTTFFSRVVNVIMGEQKTEMKIFPNPVQHHEIKTQFINLEKGKYSARLFNAKGQLVMEQVIDYNGGSANQLIQIDKQIIAGMYFFQLTNGKTKLNQTIIIE